MSTPEKTDPQTGLWLMECLVISTGHFSKEQADRLFNTAFMVEQLEEPCTCILALEDFEPGQPVREDLTPETLAVLDHLRSRGWKHVRLDRDGDHMQGFKKFNW